MTKDRERRKNVKRKREKTYTPIKLKFEDKSERLR